MNNRDLVNELKKLAGYLTKLAGEDGDLTPAEEKSGLDLARQFSRQVSERDRLYAFERMVPRYDRLKLKHNLYSPNHEGVRQGQWVWNDTTGDQFISLITMQHTFGTELVFEVYAPSILGQNVEIFDIDEDEEVAAFIKDLLRKMGSSRKSSRASSDDYVPYDLDRIQHEKNPRGYIVEQLEEAAAKGGWDLANRFDELANAFGNSGYDFYMVPVLRDIIVRWEKSDDPEDLANYKEALEGLSDEVREVL